MIMGSEVLTPWPISGFLAMMVIDAVRGDADECAGHEIRGGRGRAARPARILATGSM